MKKNRRVNKKMSVNTEIATHLGAVIAFLFVMVIMNLLASSSCQQLMKRIGEEEKELARLEDSRNRESTRWEEMKTPEKVEAALLRHGLAMRPPRPEQNVHMKADGTPYAGQLSVARAKARANANLMMASATPAKAVSKKGR